MSETLRLLMVEDRAEDADLLVLALRRGGFEPQVRRVETREALAAALAAGAWDAVTSDFNLPSFSAGEALALVRGRDPHLPFVVVSGVLGEETAVELLKTGVDDYVLKDRLRRLPEVLRRALRDARLRRERERMELALRDQQERLRLIFDHLPVLVFFRGPEGGAPWINRQWTQCLGRPPAADELAGILNPDADGPDWRDAALVAADGRTVTLAWSVVRLRDGSAVGLGLDLTERRRAESERLRLEDQLRQSQKLESIGRLAGGVAHDFNNMLAVIMGYAEMLLFQLPTGHHLREPADQIMAAAERSRDLTRQLLAFARKQTLEIRRLDLNGVVAGLEKMLRRTLREDIVLELTLGAGLPAMAGDPRQIEQILLNLAVNAQDAMAEGGRLTVSTGRRKLDEHFQPVIPEAPGREYLELRIADTGCGMTPEILKQIFEPFFTTKEAGRGTGLGLSMVYGSVQQHGGHIRVESAPGRGTAFLLYFPVSDLPAENADAAAVPAASRGHETILLVEDQSQVRDLVSQMLSLQGYQVLEADCGRAALDVSQRHAGPISLLISDVIMPDSDSRSLHAELTARHPELKVLHMSGYSEEVISTHGLLNPGTPLIHKPFHREELVRKVREVLKSA